MTELRTRLNRKSRLVTEGVERTPNRAMLRAVGFGDGDFDKPIVGVANGYSTITPCNAGLNDLAERAMESLREAQTMPQIFGTITVSDGISMGTEGMKYSLVSREVIADSIETVCGAAEVDGLVAIGGCDKNMPGAMIAIARLNIPSIFVYGGTIKPGHLDGRNLTVVSAFEAVGEFSAGRIDRAELLEVERHACPGVGSCGGMFTANTMSSAIEAMGMSLPYSSTMAAEDDEKKRARRNPRACSPRRLTGNLLPRDIMTRKAFENAIAVVMATGGSTNAVLHLLAIARAAHVPLALDDFETIRKRVPVLCDLKPSGKYVTTELHAAGGIPQVMKILLAHGVLHGDADHHQRQDRGGDARSRSERTAQRSGRDSPLGKARCSRRPSGHSERQPRAPKARWQRFPKPKRSPGRRASSIPKRTASRRSSRSKYIRAM